MKKILVILFLWVSFIGTIHAGQAAFAHGSDDTEFRGVHQVTDTGTASSNTYFTFTRPDGSTVKVHGFYDGGSVVKARVYCNQIGEWDWISTAGDGGSFTVVSSDLKGKLKASGKHFITDNGDSFIFVMDTGYVLFSKSLSFTNFKNFVSDSIKNGSTVIRTLIGTNGIQSGTIKEHVNVYYSDVSKSIINYSQFQSNEERLQYLLRTYPDLQVQLILYPLADNFKNISTSQKDKILQYMIDRYSAYPNVIFLVHNDAKYGSDTTRRNNAVHALNYLKSKDKFNTLRSTGANRILMDQDKKVPYRSEFLGGKSTYVHLETEFDLSADNYGNYGIPTVCGEDLYETYRRGKNIGFPDAFFRKLVWSWTISGGGASYGGSWDRGIRYTSLTYGGSNVTGMKHLKYVSKFFKDYNLELKTFSHSDSYASNGHSGDTRAKAMKNSSTYVVFTPVIANITISGIATNGTYKYAWYDPRNGKSTSIKTVTSKTFTIPSGWSGGVLVAGKGDDFGKPKPTGPVTVASVFTSPSNNSKLSISSTFKWRALNGKGYVKLTVRDLTSGKDIYKYNLSTTSKSISFPVNGHNISAKLETFTDKNVKVGNTSSLSLTAPKTATNTVTMKALSSPLKSPAKFAWTSLNGEGKVKLIITDGTKSPRSYTLSKNITSKTVTIDTLGQTVKAQLISYNYANEVIGSNSYTYKAELIQPAYITSHKTGSRFTSNKVVFKWNKGSSEYTKVWIKDLITGKVLKSYHTSASSLSITIPADGHKLTFALVSYEGNIENDSIYGRHDYTFYAENPKLAYMTSPSNGSRLTSTSPTFKWNLQNTEVVKVYIVDRTTNKVLKDYHTRTSSVKLTVPATGHKIEFTLVSYSNWANGTISGRKTYTYYATSPLLAYMTSPSKNGSRLTSTSPTFKWNMRNTEVVKVYIVDRTTNKALKNYHTRTSSVKLTIPATGHKIEFTLVSYSDWAKGTISGRKTYTYYGKKAAVQTRAYITSPSKNGSRLGNWTTFKWNMKSAEYVKVWIKDLTTGKVLKSYHTNKSSISFPVPKGNHKIAFALVSYNNNIKNSSIFGRRDYTFYSHY